MTAIYNCKGAAGFNSGGMGERFDKSVSAKDFTHAQVMLGKDSDGQETLTFSYGLPKETGNRGEIIYGVKSVGQKTSGTFQSGYSAVQTKTYVELDKTTGNFIMQKSNSSGGKASLKFATCREAKFDKNAVERLEPDGTISHTK